MDIRSRAKKILGPLASYRPIEERPIPPYLNTVPIPEGVGVIGVYENIPNSQKESVIVTDQGISVTSEQGTCFLPFRDIAKVRLCSEKSEAGGLTVTLKDGNKRFVPIRNGHGRFKDVFEFLRFTDRTVRQFISK
jgi:hypothetical protein